MSNGKGRSPALWFLALAAIFALRLIYGLSLELYSDDTTQIYLMGLRFHVSHAWPYFGPDVVWTRSEIPGALQALLVGLPLDALPIPEAPYIFLNLLSMAALCWYASYLSARLPTIPKWLIYGWLLTLPWTMNYSTHIMNPSYVLPASIGFFIGFFEAWPSLAIGRVRVPVAHALMGAAVGWIAQVHMSWPLLLPFVGFAFLYRLREGVVALARAAVGFIAGLAVTASVLIPTFIRFGAMGSGGTGQNVAPHWIEPFSNLLFTTARFLAFSSYEISRFVASGSAKQSVFFRDHLWLFPIALLVWIAGVGHPIWMTVTAFRRKSAEHDWSAVRWIAVGGVLMVTASFFFVMQPPQARMYYLMAPLAFMYAAYCWTFVDSPRMRRVAVTVIASNIALHAALIVVRWPGASLYVDRPLVAEAIRQNDPQRFAHRREFAKDVPASDLASAIKDANVQAHLEVTNAVLRRPIFNFTAWTFTVHNRSDSLSYRGLLCETTYYDAQGRQVGQHIEDLAPVVPPGGSREMSIVDGVVWTDDMVRGEVRIISAEPLQARIGR